MTQWNLSVRLTGQGSDLSRTLRTTAADARAASRDIQRLRRDIGRLRADTARDIRLRVTVDARHLRREVQTAVRGASAGSGIRIPLTVDARRLRADIERALGATSGQSIRVGLQLDDPSRLRREIDDAVRDATAGQGIRIPITGDGGGQQLGGSLASSSSSAKSLTRDLLLLSQVLVPIAAAAVPLAGDIAGAFGAAGAGAAAFGAAVAGQLAPLAEAIEAQTKLEDAVDQYGAASEEAAKASREQQVLIAKLPPATREATAAFSALKSEYQDWSDSLSGVTMEPVTHGLQLTTALLPKLTPMVRSTSAEFDRLLTLLAGGFNTPGFDEFMDRLNTASASALHELGSGIVRLSSAAGDFDGGPIAEFMAFAHAHGPLVAETLGNLVQALAHIVAAAADSGVGILHLANAFAQLVTAIPSDLLSVMIGLYTGMRLLSVGMTAVAAIASSGAIARLAAYFAVMRAAGVGTTLSATATSMTAMQKAGIGLGVLAIAAIGIDKLADKARGAPPDVDRLTTSLKNLARTGEMTGELKRTFGDLDGLVDKVKKLQSETEKANNTAFGFRVPVLDDVADWIAGNVNDIEKGGESLKALKGDFDSLDQAMAQMVSAGHGKQAAQDFDVMKTALQKAGVSTKEINALFPQYRDAVAALKAEQQLAAQGMGVFGQQAISTKAKLDAQKASADGLRQSIQALNDAQRSGLGGMIGFEAAIDAATTAAKANAGALTMSGGQLNLNSEKARNAATALNDLAAKTDEAAASARQSGASWETVNGIYSRGREALVSAAMQMGLTSTQANQLASSILKIPDKKSTQLEMRTEDARAGLDAFIAKVKQTPNSKSVTVKALTDDAIRILEDLGYRVRRLPDGQVQVTALTGTAVSGINAVQAARDRLSSKTISITTRYYHVGKPGSGVRQLPYATGGRVRGYATGGDIQAFPAGGYIDGPGTGTSDSILALFGSGAVGRVSNTEYVIRAAAVSKYGTRLLDAINSGQLPEPPGYATGGSTGGMDFTYSGSGSSANRYTLSGLVSASNDKKGKFSLSIFASKLRASNNLLDSWRADLARVAARAGQDVADALAEMGDEGIALTRQMARGSSKYLNDMAAQLRNLAGAAKASLGEYTSQLNAAVKDQTKFQANLATLAAQGYGALAGRLAGQNNEDAEALAAAAVKDRSKASAANKAATAANNALTGEQLAQLVQIIAAIRTKSTGIHDVAARTGLGEDVIIAAATKATSQIRSSLGDRASRFLADLARANKGLSYANGGIRSGIYATKGGAVTFAEPSTGGEAYIPLGANKRRHALPVLSDVAGRFGLGLRDAAEGRVVIVREKAPLVGQQTWNVSTWGDAIATARRIDADNAYQLRRLARGGVAAR